MKEYIGKICPYCKSPFREEDDIVVCSSCDMPHHKECWIENQGCTTFGCLGTIKAPTSGASSSVANQTIDFDIGTPTSRFVYCPKCGAQNADANNFCEKCGQTLAAQKAASPQHTHYTVSNQGSGYSSNNVSQPYMQGGQYQGAAVQNPYMNSQQQYYNPAAQNPYMRQQSQVYNPVQTPQQTQFYGQQVYQGYNYQNQTQYSNWSANPALEAVYVGNNSTYYAQAFSEMRQGNKKTSWNWCAFLFSAYWLAYRKMYGYSAAYCGAAIIATQIGGLGSLLLLAGSVCCGIFANHLYLQRIEQAIKETSNISEPMRSQQLNQRGGTSVGAPIIAFFGTAIVSGLFFL